jgi:hypothetical protein
MRLLQVVRGSEATPNLGGLTGAIEQTKSSSRSISPDGKRFLMIKSPASTGAAPSAAGPREISIVLNWLEELKQRVPVK